MKFFLGGLKFNNYDKIKEHVDKISGNILRRQHKKRMPQYDKCLRNSGNSMSKNSFRDADLLLNSVSELVLVLFILINKTDFLDVLMCWFFQSIIIGTIL